MYYKSNNTCLIFYSNHNNQIFNYKNYGMLYIPKKQMINH